jgi:hypothetical protein
VPLGSRQLQEQTTVASRTSSKSSKLRRVSTTSTKKSASRQTKSHIVRAVNAGSETASDEDEVAIDRRRADRRDEETGQLASASSAAPQLERRKKVNRRRQIDPTTCERDYTDQEVEFMNALDDYKRKSGRMFPTCSEVLEVLRGLGYVKLSASELGAMAVDTASATSAKPMPNAWQSAGPPVDAQPGGAAFENATQFIEGVGTTR